MNVAEAAKAEQPDPTGNGEVVLFKAMQVLMARGEVGMATYNTLLKTNNGRDAGAEVLQEIADAFVYSVQDAIEREEREKKLRKLIRRLGIELVSLLPDHRNPEADEFFKQNYDMAHAAILFGEGKGPLPEV